MDEIINKVANSKLKTIDLEDFYPEGERILFDIKDWLYEGIILKEKDFREQAQNFDWSTLQNKYVAFTCSVDAIIPSWAFLLLTTYAIPYAKKAIIGNLDQLNSILYVDIINNFDGSQYEKKPVIIKGCSNKPIPESAFSLLIEKLVPFASKIMYGEACSTVPLFKNKGVNK